MPKTMPSTALDLMRKIKERDIKPDISEAALIMLIKETIGANERTIEAYLDYFVDVGLMTPINKDTYRLNFERADELML